MVSIEAVIITISLIIPALIQFRYYLQLRSVNYLYLSLFLLFLGVNVITNEVFSASGLREIGNILSLSLVFTFLLLVLENTTERKIPPSPNSRRILIILYGFVFSSMYVLFDVSNQLSTILVSKIIVEEFLQGFIGLIVYLTYGKITLVIKDDRLERIRRTWQILGLVMIIAAILRIITYSVILLEHFLENTPYDDLTSLQEIGGIFITLGLLIIGPSIFLIVLVYPESMLLTEYQISKVGKLYDIINMSDDLVHNDKKNILDRDFLISYLANVATKRNDILNGNEIHAH